MSSNCNKPAHSYRKMHLKLFREEHNLLFPWKSPQIKTFKTRKNSPPFYISFFTLLFYHFGTNVERYSRTVSLLISYVYCEYPGALNYQVEKKFNFAGDYKEKKKQTRKIKKEKERAQQCDKNIS